MSNFDETMRDQRPVLNMAQRLKSGNGTHNNFIMEPQSGKRLSRLRGGNLKMEEAVPITEPLLGYEEAFQPSSYSSKLSALIRKTYTVPAILILASLIFLSVMFSNMGPDSHVVKFSEVKDSMNGFSRSKAPSQASPSSDSFNVPVPTIEVVTHNVPKIRDDKIVTVSTSTFKRKEQAQESSRVALTIRYKFPKDTPTSAPWLAMQQGDSNGSDSSLNVLWKYPADTPTTAPWGQYQKDLEERMKLVQTLKSPSNVIWKAPADSPTTAPWSVNQYKRVTEIANNIGQQPSNIFWKYPADTPTTAPWAQHQNEFEENIRDGIPNGNDKSLTSPSNIMWKVPNDTPTTSPFAISQMERITEIATLTGHPPSNIIWKYPAQTPTTAPFGEYQEQKIKRIQKMEQEIRNNEKQNIHPQSWNSPLNIMWKVPDDTPTTAPWADQQEKRIDDISLTTGNSPSNIMWKYPAETPTTSPFGVQQNKKMEQLQSLEKEYHAKKIDAVSSPSNFVWKQTPADSPTSAPWADHQNKKVDEISSNTGLSPNDIIWRYPENSPTSVPWSMSQAEGIENMFWFLESDNKDNIEELLSDMGFQNKQVEKIINDIVQDNYGDSSSNDKQGGKKSLLWFGNSRVVELAPPTVSPIPAPREKVKEPEMQVEEMPLEEEVIPEELVKEIPNTNADKDLMPLLNDAPKQTTIQYSQTSNEQVIKKKNVATVPTKPTKQHVKNINLPVVEKELPSEVIHVPASTIKYASNQNLDNFNGIRVPQTYSPPQKVVVHQNNHYVKPNPIAVIPNVASNNYVYPAGTTTVIQSPNKLVYPVVPKNVAIHQENNAPPPTTNPTVSPVASSNTLEVDEEEVSEVELSQPDVDVTEVIAVTPQEDLGLTTTMDTEELIKEVPCPPVDSSALDDSQAPSGEDEAIYEIYYSNPIKTCGVIIEIGAGNGIYHSKSYFFENALHWKTLLIEANPDTYEQLQTNRPKSQTVNGGFCSGNELDFYDGSFRGQQGPGEAISEIHGEDDFPEDSSKIIKVPCLNLADVFKGQSITKIDLMYIAVDGDVLSIIREMDWMIRVDIWVIELDGDEDNNNVVRRVLTNNDYVAAEWDIRRWCNPYMMGHCMPNEVFLAKGFNPLPQDVGRRLTEVQSRRRLREDGNRNTKKSAQHLRQ